MAKVLLPYISIDLETTGLDLERSQILQIAAVYDDGKSPIAELPRFNVFINEPITYAELGALVLHAKSGLFSRIQEANKKGESKKLSQGIDDFLKFLDDHRNPREGGGKYKVNLAGKNAGTYDIPILKNWMNYAQGLYFKDLIYCSIIDAGSIYFRDFGRIPSLGEILKHIQAAKTEVTHDAMEDALDVVIAIRHRFGILH